MNILITGGAGYIGMELVYQLANQDEVDRIVIFDNLSRDNYNMFIGHSKLNDKVQFAHGDILDSRRLKKLVDQADIVYHLAAKVTTPFMDTNAHEFEQINNWGTSEVVYAVENSNVQKFVYLSSVSVYGANDQVIETVDGIPDPMTYYGISKRKGEEHVERLIDKKDTYIFRAGNVYGYNKSMRFDAVINRFMFEANYNKKLMVKGSGAQKRTFIHIKSVSENLAKIVDGSLEKGVYNLTESNWSILDVADVIHQIYPGTEMLFRNQDFPIKSITVKPDPKMPWLKEADLKSELEAFKENFTF